MHAMLAAANTPDTFNADYYIAVVTVLPILVVAVEVLVNFNKSIPDEQADKLPYPLLTLIVFYLISIPIIAAGGIIAGVLALMYRSANAAYQWVTFSCLLSVLVFMAISATLYLWNSDSQGGDERREGERQESAG